MEIEMKITPHHVTLSRSCEGSRIANEILRLTPQNDKKCGFTLIEVVLAVVVVAIAVSATLVVLSKMMGYTVNRGRAVDISNAVTISQMAIDQVRDQKFPPTGSSGTLGTISDSSITISSVTYTYSTDIVAFDGNPILAAEYNIPNVDEMPGDHNLLKVTVTVSKNGRPLLKTVTYKTRNGYY
ncbi:MAG: prepilin-type N-terminal cleavage/methylation domain-containing protein [Candidatus Omnitrophota bacterium]